MGNLVKTDYGSFLVRVSDLLDRTGKKENSKTGKYCYCSYILEDWSLNS